MSEIQSIASVKSEPVSPFLHLTPSQIHRELVLSDLAEEVARLLYKARALHYGPQADASHLPWSIATRRDKDACRDVAEVAVMAANEYKQADACRQVTVALEDTIRHIEHTCEMGATLEHPTHSAFVMVGVRSALRAVRAMGLGGFVKGVYVAALKGERRS